MARRITVDDATFARLSGLPRPGETVNDVLARLRPPEKPALDPFAFLRSPRSGADLDDWIRHIENDRDDATVDA